MNILTIIIIGFIVLGLMAGYKKGFVRSIPQLPFNIAHLALSVFLAAVIWFGVVKFTPVDDYLNNVVAGVIDKDLDEKIAREYRIAYKIDLTKEDPGKIQELKNEIYKYDPSLGQHINILNSFGLSSNFRKTIKTYVPDKLVELDSKMSNVAGVTDETFAHYVARCAVEDMLKLVSFLIAFSICDTLISTIQAFMYKVEEIPILGKIDKLCGAAAMGCLGLVVAWCALWVLSRHTGDLGIMARAQIESSNVLMAIQNNNIFVHAQDTLDYVIHIFG